LFDHAPVVHSAFIAISSAWEQPEVTAESGQTVSTTQNDNQQTQQVLSIQQTVHSNKQQSATRGQRTRATQNSDKSHVLAMSLLVT
jgi:hypothetical protein